MIELKDIDGDVIDVDLSNNGYVEIMIESTTGCAPLDKENAMKLADAIYKHFGENK